MSNDSILAIDIGAGTQDILLYNPAESLENAVKLVLPSPTRIIASRIRAAARLKRPVFLAGRLMGGGAVSGAVRNHLQQGLKVYSLPGPALTLHDNLDEVRRLGVIIVDGPVEGAVEIRMGDLDREALAVALALFEVQLPDITAVALQDHGFSPEASNRLARFAHWNRFLSAGGRLRDLTYTEPPPELTRMAAAADGLAEAYFMDTGAAAVRGAVLDEFVGSRLEEGLVVVNAGNGHTMAALVKADRIWGIYEHHTGLLDSGKLADHLERFKLAELGHQEIFDQHGHGVAYHPEYKEVGPFKRVVITGPRREIARGLGHEAAPFGEMMLSGCFGLVEGVLERKSGQAGFVGIKPRRMADNGQPGAKND